MRLTVSCLIWSEIEGRGGRLREGLMPFKNRHGCNGSIHRVTESGRRGELINWCACPCHMDVPYALA